MARIKVSAARPEGEIDPMIYGHFVENMARCIYGGLLRNEKPGRARGPWRLREDLAGYVRELRPPVIRWPGGLYADGYFWRDGIGPRESRPLLRNRYWSRYGPFTRVLDPNWFGSDEYMELVNDLGAEPYVNVNLGTGTAAEAARWVEYMNGDESTPEGRRRASFGHEAPWDVRYWGIGNEMYGFWTLGRSGALEYAKRYLEYRSAMSEVDPALRYVAVGADHYFKKDWNREVLEEAGGSIDLLSIHVYLPGPERMVDVAASRARHGETGLYRAILAAPYEFERRLWAAERDIRSVMGSGSGVGIALDEWNLWWKPSQLLVPRWTLRDALFVCGMFHAMHRTSDFVKMGNIAQLVNVLGVLSASGDRTYRSTMYYAFKLYRALAGHLRLGVEVECGRFESPRLGGIPAMDGVPLLDCSATMGSGKDGLTLFVINRHMTDDITAGIDIEGFDTGSRVEVRCLNGPAPGAANWYGRDETVRISESEADTGDVMPAYRFPAHSATALVFR